eukprot:scaffold2341_cov294-Chaetoceros_neogracile.AAC.1
MASGISMPPSREKATPMQILEDKFAVVDHISMETCCGQDSNFYESKIVPASMKNNWGRTAAVVFRELSEVCNGIHHQHRLADEYELKLERRIKMRSRVKPAYQKQTTSMEG